MTVPESEELAAATPVTAVATPVPVTKVRGGREALWFARRNRKLLVGLAVVLVFLVGLLGGGWPRPSGCWSASPPATAAGPWTRP